MKKAFITGVTGQDGYYLTKLLLEKGYRVIGLVRRNSLNNYSNIEEFLTHDNFIVEYGDLTDFGALNNIIKQYCPDEVYNLGAMSHVRMSFDQPEYTANVDALGVLRILESIRINDLSSKTKFYQASTSELYGLIQDSIQTEKTPFYPRSPYGVSKLFGYWTTVNYRESYNIFACNGILFNHESPKRGVDFVTRKITVAAAKISKNLQECLFLGNLDAKRDWGFAGDYVEGMWRMLQQEVPDDYVLATGKTNSVRDFTTLAFKFCDINLIWEGEAGTINEQARDERTGKILVKVNPEFFRPAEVDLLLGDPSHARDKLGWESSTGLEELCREMVEEDLKNISGN
jgi:GDPmannose 4,6-dehydratase